MIIQFDSDDLAKFAQSPISGLEHHAVQYTDRGYASWK